IGYHKAVLSRYLRETTDRKILADNRDLVSQSVLYGLGLIQVPLLSQERIQICRIGSQRLLRNRLNVCLEILVLCHEIGLRVNLYDRCLLIAVGYHTAKSLSRDTACLLLSLGLSVLSQELNR